MSISLKKLQKKKLDVGVNRLSGYIDVERWLAMCNASAAEMQHLTKAWPMPHLSHTYDAAAVSRILGLPCTSGVSIPKAEDGEIVIYYGGWDLPTLRNCVAGRERMWQNQDWYDEKGWDAEPGYYRLLLPVPDSNCKKWDEQVRHFKTIDSAWKPTPICVGATALLVHLAETGVDPLKGDWARFADALPGGRRAVLRVSEGRARVGSYWDGNGYGDVWSSAARKC